jgi:hypothetical protein
VEDSWERNAEEVAAEVDRLFRRFAPEVVLVTGDEHALSALTAALVKPVLDKLVRIEGGGRAAGTSQEALHESAERALARHIADRDILGRVAGRRAPRARGCRGSNSSPPAKPGRGSRRAVGAACRMSSAHLAWGRRSTAPERRAWGAPRQPPDAARIEMEERT